MVREREKKSREKDIQEENKKMRKAWEEKQTKIFTRTHIEKALCHTRTVKAC